MPVRLKVGRVDDFPAGEVKVIEAGGERIAVANVEGDLYAFEDRCTHDDGPLGEGELDGYEVVCPRHGARFDVRDGAVRSMPAVYPVKTFPVVVEDGQVEVILEEAFG